MQNFHDEDKVNGIVEFLDHMDSTFTVKLSDTFNQDLLPLTHPTGEGAASEGATAARDDAAILLSKKIVRKKSYHKSYRGKKCSCLVRQGTDIKVPQPGVCVLCTLPEKPYGKGYKFHQFDLKPQLCAKGQTFTCPSCLWSISVGVAHNCKTIQLQYQAYVRKSNEHSRPVKPFEEYRQYRAEKTGKKVSLLIYC